MAPSPTLIGNMQAFFRAPHLIDLTDPARLDGSNNLLLENHEHFFRFIPTATETVAKFVTEVRDGRVIRLRNDGTSAVTLTHTAYGSATEGQMAVNAGTNLALGRGDSVELQCNADGVWVQIGAGDVNA